MSESAPLSIGHALRAARESQGLTVEDAASRLRLMHRQIEAMETEDFDSLGQPVFARGFVRNYARLLGLSPEPLLAGMAGAPRDAEPVAPLPARESRHWLTSPWTLLFFLFLLLAAAVPVGLYWWLNSDSEEIHPVAMITSKSTGTQQIGERATVTEHAQPAPVTPEADRLAAPAAAAQPPVDSAVAEERPPREAEGGQGRLTFEFSGDAWVEVRDGQGSSLMRRLNPSGTRAEVTGMPPFDLVIGNAAEVRMRYNGRPFELAPFIGETVARFTLEE